LLHEVYSKEKFDGRTEFWKNYHSRNHTSTYELADIAATLKPDLLVLYHILFWGAEPEDLLAEIAERYDGKVVIGSDLDVFE
jgi:ribonuclease BN (tRNA processing enzyme)